MLLVIKKIFTTLLLIFVSLEVFSQNQNDITTMVPESLILQADTAFINGANLTGRERRAQKERKRVAKLLREVIEDHKFQFEALYSMYRGQKFNADGQTFRCYGGRIVCDLILCRGEYAGGIEVIGNSTNFKLTNIHSDDDNDYVILFEVILQNTAIIDGHTYNQLSYEFATNILNGETAVKVTAGEKVCKQCGIFTGYINDLR